jgi:hypothetical protein
MVTKKWKKISKSLLNILRGIICDSPGLPEPVRQHHTASNFMKTLRDRLGKRLRIHGPAASHHLIQATTAANWWQTAPRRLRRRGARHWWRCVYRIGEFWPEHWRVTNAAGGVIHVRQLSRYSHTHDHHRQEKPDA